MQLRWLWNNINSRDEMEVREHSFEIMTGGQGSVFPSPNRFRIIYYHFPVFGLFSTNLPLGHRGSFNSAPSEGLQTLVNGAPPLLGPDENPSFVSGKPITT